MKAAPEYSLQDVMAAISDMNQRFSQLEERLSQQMHNVAQRLTQIEAKSNPSSRARTPPIAIPFPPAAFGLSDMGQQKQSENATAAQHKGDTAAEDTEAASAGTETTVAEILPEVEGATAELPSLCETTDQTGFQSDSDGSEDINPVKVISDEKVANSQHSQLDCTCAAKDSDTEKHSPQLVMFTQGSVANLHRLDAVWCNANGNHLLLAFNALLRERVLWDPGGI